MAGRLVYVREHGVDVMVGCASFEGDPGAHAMALAFSIITPPLKAGVCGRMSTSAST